MQIRQSDLKTWQRCPLQWRFKNIDQLPEEQSCALTFGTIIHACVLWMEVNQDLPGALDRFKHYWVSPELFEDAHADVKQGDLKIDYFLRGRSWKKYMDDGQKILRDWWGIIQWDPDVIIAREQQFVVPIGDGHELKGTIDKLTIRYHPKLSEHVLLIGDYKTTGKMPTYDYLEEDLQFSAYAYATTRPEFWTGVKDGGQLMEYTKGMRRMGEWVQLRGPVRRDAGERTERHYARLEYAANAIAQSVAMRIFVPNISGESCRYCDFRKPCGLPEIMEAAA